MARTPTKTTEAKTPAIAPVYALHRIRYGDKKLAAADSIFVPTSAAERQELLDLKAARELNDVEKIVASQMKFDTVDAEPEVDPAEAALG